MKKEYDVIITGAGPAGSTAAYFLAKAGKKVLMVDKARFPRVKVCAGWITPEIFKVLELDPAEYPMTLQTFDKGEVVVGEKYYESSFNSTASYGIIRQEFDTYLARRAAATGADFIEGEKVKEFNRNEQNGVDVTLSDGNTYQCSILIGAGGNACPVSRKWGSKSKDEDLILATESETKIGADRLRNLTPYYGTTELFAEPDQNGYAWYVTKGDWVNIGIGRFSSGTDNLKTHLEQFMNKLRNLGRLEGIEEEMVSFGRHAYKLYDDLPRQKYGNNFMIIGDAAGFASPWAGEGIKPATITAKMAAETALEAIEKNNYTAEIMKKYEEKVIQRFGKQKPTVTGKLLSSLPRAVKIKIANTICKSSYLRKKLIFEKAFGFEETGT